ncbi:helix-turn-helix transcriptional regulator [Parasphingopyxis algicola]|uniref:winged helix-turn-helix transcriptional regulator n=1 Tax=Parasphingopyxis algicola TaxID=2026624 RepID=UPI0015A474D5|nr:helix-turn-helix domain-containing protein [Parasphingopyxis algicola]QLC26563.1 helix-turn-helix transcriptional regulator [Parasphingopyxis algicola]
MKYSQFCPIAKAVEILGNRWTLLVVREILMGGTRFSELQRGLGTISTAVLTERLKELAENGMIVRRKISGRRGYEYFPTPACNELKPIIVSLGEWGMRWAKDNLVEEDYDISLLMLYLERSVARDMLPGPQTVLQFDFSDLKTLNRWWLIVDDERVDVCQKDPGQDVDVYFSSTVKTMADVWLGHRTYRDAIRKEELSIVGEQALTRNVDKWLVSTTFDM